MTKVRNDLFDSSQGLDRGRPFLVEAIWYLAKCFLFLTPLPVPSRLKCAILRLFGARIGKGVVIKPQVKIHFPWKLTVGDFAWIGEEVFILNFEPIIIGAHCCISQRTFLCGGSHDYRKPEMPYRNKPIKIEDGVWLGAQVFVSPGVTIGSDAVIATGSVVTTNQPPGMVCGGNPCVPIKDRWQTKENVENLNNHSISTMESASGPQNGGEVLPCCPPVTMDLPAYTPMRDTGSTDYDTAGDTELQAFASAGGVSADKR